MKNKGAILVILWSFLVNSVFHFLTIGPNLLVPDKNEETYFGAPVTLILLSVTLIFPLLGWLSDSYLGRYKVVRYSTWIMWISMIVLAVWYILDEYYVVGEYLSNYKRIRIAIYLIFCVVLGVGLGGFNANVVQLGIDQLIDASSAEITSFITSYVLALFSGGVAFFFANSCYGSLGNSSRHRHITHPAVCICVSYSGHMP